MSGEPGEINSDLEHTRTAVDDWRDLGDLVALATERVTAPVQGIHEAIARRWFGMAGRRAANAHEAYLALMAGVYRSVRLTGTALGAAVGLGAATAARRKPLRPLWRSRAVGSIQAVGNAVWGDELECRRADPRTELNLRSSTGEPIGAECVALEQGFPHPSARIVVLLHGLGETERCWQGRTASGVAATGLAEVLEADSFTPLLIRYNSGRHVSDNGDALAALIDQVVDCWPVAVEDISLLGNSMGGLVARSAVHAGRSAGHSWTYLTSHLITLGSPHLGAPLEKFANLIAWGLRLAPESRPLGEFLNHRSAGIKDLRFGAIRDEDWSREDPDALLSDSVGDTRLPDHVDQHFVAGVITSVPTHPVGVLLGDLIVRAGSGTGRGRRRRIEVADVRVIGGRRHSDLLHDPAVHEQVRDWLRTKADNRNH